MVRQAHQQSGKATRSLPGEDDSDDERQALEDRHTGKIATALRAIMRKVAPPGTTVNNITPDIAVSRYREASNLLRDALVAMLTDGVLLGAQVGGQQVEYILGVRKATILGVDWDLINQDALAWVLSNPSQLGQGFGNGYANAVVSAMNTTSEQQLTTQVGEWIRNGLTYRSLIDQMERTVFSRQRAEMVATTEITRSFAAGNQAAWRRSGIIKEMRWRTANDERVCNQCGPLNGVVVDIDGDFSRALPDDQERARGTFQLPPAHVRCRCVITPVARAPERVEPQPMVDIPLPQVIGDINQQSLGVISDEFQKLASEYPELTKWVKSFDFTHLTSGFEYDTEDQSVRMRRTYANLTPNEISGLMRGSNVVRRPEIVGDEAFRDTIIHEIGHALDRNIGVRFRSLPDIQDAYFDEINGLRSRFGRVSEYGETNRREWVAEKFTAERIGIHEKAEVQEIFKKYIKILHDNGLADLDFTVVPR